MRDDEPDLRAGVLGVGEGKAEQPLPGKMAERPAVRACPGVPSAGVGYRPVAALADGGRGPTP